MKEVSRVKYGWGGGSESSLKPNVQFVTRELGVKWNHDNVTLEVFNNVTVADFLLLLFLQSLYAENDAIVLCTGATWPRDLPIPGRELEGIHFAMSFLENWQKKQMGNDVNVPKLLAKDKDVIVIGGGDTGCDCIATSLRQVYQP